MVEYTHIRLEKSTVEALKRIGHKGETYDQIIKRLIKEHEDNVLKGAVEP